MSFQKRKQVLSLWLRNYTTTSKKTFPIELRSLTETYLKDLLKYKLPNIWINLLDLGQQHRLKHRVDTRTIKHILKLKEDCTFVITFNSQPIRSRKGILKLERLSI